MNNLDQDIFMQQIAARLGRDRIINKPDHPYRGAPQFWQDHQLNETEKIECFMTNWTNVGGHAKMMSSSEETASYIHSLVQQLSVKRIIHHDEPMLHDLVLRDHFSAVEVTVWDGQSDRLIDRAADADLGIVVADYAVAETGSVVLCSASHKGRSVSLLPGALIVLIKPHTLYTTMGEVMQQLQPLSPAQMPAGIHFVSGPSRSADIENDLTIGVHGPGIVYALILPS